MLAARVEKCAIGMSNLAPMLTVLEHRTGGSSNLRIEKKVLWRNFSLKTEQKNYEKTKIFLNPERRNSPMIVNR